MFLSFQTFMDLFLMLKRGRSKTLRLRYRLMYLIQSELHVLPQLHQPDGGLDPNNKLLHLSLATVLHKWLSPRTSPCK